MLLNRTWIRGGFLIGINQQRRGYIQLLRGTNQKDRPGLQNAPEHIPS